MKAEVALVSTNPTAHPPTNPTTPTNRGYYMSILRPKFEEDIMEVDLKFSGNKRRPGNPMTSISGPVTDLMDQFLGP